MHAQINWAMHDKQELIDIVEVVYRGARKGHGLVVSPKGALSAKGKGSSSLLLHPSDWPFQLPKSIHCRGNALWYFGRHAVYTLREPPVPRVCSTLLHVAS